MLAVVSLLTACKDPEPVHPYLDLTHFSKTFGRDKTFRVYLPKTYQDNATKYPVVYFFHGWGGRYGSDDNAKLAYDSLQRLVDKYQVLLVMWDGNIDESEPRPYNVGDHDNIKYDVQMKDYFPELVAHVDSIFRTVPDRGHRGIIGFSMGGFMSYFLAGKYPGMVCAAVGMTGSPEFFVGNPVRHTLYPLRYTFENLRDVKLRFHNSTADELTYLNTEVKHGAAWDGRVNFDYWQFVGGHMVDLPGETRVFEKALAFVTEAFKSPLPPAVEWTHHDLYPQFDIYGYQVQSNMRKPGFISMRHVKPNGFGIGTAKWLPDGPPLDSVTVQVTTAPVYPPNAMMHVVKWRTDGSVLAESNVKADEHGRLHFYLDGANYEMGISPAGSENADVIATGYQVGDKHRSIKPGDNEVRFSLLNHGKIRPGQRVELSVTSTDSTLFVSTPAPVVMSDKRSFDSNPVTIRCKKKAPSDATPPFVRLRVGVTTMGATNYNELVVPVIFDVPPFIQVTIDDNRKVNDSTAARGQGNGDGIADPGERIVIYVDGHPLKIYADSPYVTTSKEEQFDIMVPAKWPDGFTFASIIKMSENIPAGTKLQLLGNYETKEFMPVKRQVHWGKVEIVTP